MKEQEIYNMKPHTFLDLGEVEGHGVRVFRVPGGWNYVFRVNSGSISSSFVPYNFEFWKNPLKEKGD